MATKVAGELYESITGQLFEIGRQLRQPNGYPFDPEELKEHLQAVIEGRFVNPKVEVVSVGRQTFKVLVDYTKSLKKMIQAGQYDWVNDDITSDHFPVKGNGQKEKEITLFYFNRDISSDDVIAEMGRAGYRPAKIEELLALGAVEKELQKQFPIIALGSVWRTPPGPCHVPALRWISAGRDLRLSWFGAVWAEDWRFAAVRK